MTLEAQKGNWDEYEKKDENKNKGSQSTNGKIVYMTFEDGKRYQIRLVGSHVKYRKWFSPISAITHDDLKGKDPVWNAGFYPPERRAIHCIDRADGQLKVLDKGAGLFKNFADFKAIHGIDPAGKDAPDWIIQPTIKPDKQGRKLKKNTEYKVDATRDNHPLTEDELKMINEKRWDLPKIYKSATLEKIQELWDALSDEEKIPPKRESKYPPKDGYKSAKAETTPASAPKVESNDLASDSENISDSDVFGKTDSGDDSSGLF